MDVMNKVKASNNDVGGLEIWNEWYGISSGD